MKQNTKKTLQFYWKHIKKLKLHASILFAAVSIATLLGMVWTIVTAGFFDTLASDSPKDEIVTVLFATLTIVIIIEFVQFIFWRIAEYTSAYFSAKVMENIGNECFERLHHHSVKFFDNDFVGSLVKRVNKMVFAFDAVFDKLLWNMLPMVLRVLTIIAVLWWINPLLGVAMLTWTLLFLIGNFTLSVFKLKYDIARSKADTAVTGALADTITNHKNIKLFSALKFEMRRFMRVTHDRYAKTMKTWMIENHLNALQTILMIALEFIVLYMAIRLWSNDLITIGAFFIIQAYLFEMFKQLWDFGHYIRELYEKLADAEEMTVILNTPYDVEDVPNAKALKAKSGRVDFEDVTFSYENSRGIINNLSFSIKSGEKIALIGPSGGGKSTIVTIILRLFNLDSGAILIDGQDISQVTQESLRKNIALVPQDPILFHRSLMENIRYGRPAATNQEVIAAAKMAHCHEFITSFTQGYSTHVGERGVKLSGGQRQRVAIARAILSNAEILILDEATSSLDSESESLIQDALENLVKNKTTFIIAHRLSTIQKADRIFVLKEGKIVEEGQHSDLANKKGGLYKKLWDMQVGGYL